MQIYVNTRSLRPPLTGVQRYTAEILRRLGPSADPIRPNGAARGPLGHLWEQAVLPGRVRGGVLWSPANTGPLAVAQQVLTIHDMVAFDHPEWLSGRFGGWYRWLLPRLVHRVARIVTVSEFTRSRIVETFGVERARVEVVPNGVDARFTSRAPAAAHAAIRKLGIEGEYLLFVGSLEPRKNLRRLLQAWRMALPELPADVELVLAGALGDVSIFGKLDLGPPPERVRLLGHVGDELLPELYAGAAAFVYPSIYEGFGMPPLEAMAAGAPVLAARASAIPEVVGDAALLVDPLDVEAIAGGIVELLGDAQLRSRLREAGLQRARAFSWDTAAERVGQILIEMG